MATATYKMRESGTDRPFRVRGTADDRNSAIAEANAKLAMTVGTIESATISEELTGGDLGVVHAAGLFSDANLSLRNPGGKVVSIFLENISTALGTGANGVLDLTDPLIVAFAAGYVDGSGNNDYIPYDGHFVS